MFKWSCFSLAAVATIVLTWMLNDLRLELKRSATTVNDHLPQILENTSDSTATLAALSEDVEQLRDLAGLPERHHDRTLVAFADDLLDRIETSGGKIGLERLVGRELKLVKPAEEWVVGARKEAVLLITVRSVSREELLEKLCRNTFKNDWYIQFENGPPLKLIDWLRKNHSDLFDEPESTE